MLYELNNHEEDYEPIFSNYTLVRLPCPDGRHKWVFQYVQVVHIVYS